MSSNVARAPKIKIPKRNPKHDEAPQSWPHLTQILHYSLAEPIVAQPKQTICAGPSSPQKNPILRKEKETIEVSDASDSDLSSVRRSKRQLGKQKKASNTQTQSIVQNIQNTEGYSIEIPTSDTTFCGVASSRSSNKNWTVDSNPKLPLEMTIPEAE